MSKVYALLAGAFIVMGLGFFGAPAMAQTPSNGLLNVYVQVINNYGTANVMPGDFTVMVSGSNPSPSTFAGSINGTQVSLNAGSYGVSVNPPNQNVAYAYQPSYSQGCNGTISNGGTALCIVTVSASNTYNQYPTPFPYPYQYPQLSCQPSSQTVGLRQNVSFTAVGGTGGTYNWTTPNRNYPNVGPVLTISFDSTGTQLVTVTNANQTATCVVNVSGTYNPVLPTYPTYPPYPAGPQTPGYQNPSVSIYPTVYPSLPNTGFEPLTAGELALASVMIGVAALLSAPYVRKAFVVVTK